MKFGELLFVGALLGIPFLLVVNAWRAYLSRDHHGMPLLRIRLVLVSVSSGAWLLFYSLVLIAEHNGFAKSILARTPSSLTLSLSNLVLCTMSLALSLRDGHKSANTKPMRRALRYTSVYLVLVWLFVLTARH